MGVDPHAAMMPARQAARARPGRSDLSGLPLPPFPPEPVPAVAGVDRAGVARQVTGIQTIAGKIAVHVAGHVAAQVAHAALRGRPARQGRPPCRRVLPVHGPASGQPPSQNPEPRPGAMAAHGTQAQGRAAGTAGVAAVGTGEVFAGRYEPLVQTDEDDQDMTQVHIRRKKKFPRKGGEHGGLFPFPALSLIARKGEPCYLTVVRI